METVAVLSQVTNNENCRNSRLSHMYDTTYADVMFVHAYITNSDKQFASASGCSAGQYGSECQQLCGQCKGSSACNRLTGVCPDGCDPGWTTLYCNNSKGGLSLSLEEFNTIIIKY